MKKDFKDNFVQGKSGPNLDDLSPNKLQDMPSANYSEGVHSILDNSTVEGHNFINEAKIIYQNRLYRVSAYVFSLTIIAMLIASILLEIYENAFKVAMPLTLLFIPTIFTLFWLHNIKRNPAIALLSLGISATILVCYLLVFEGPTDGSAVLWVALYPAVIVLYMGLRYGTVLFIVFYIFLISLIFTPMGNLMAVQLTQSMEYRLLIVCLGGFIFVWSIEFTRFKTDIALHEAAYRIEQSALTDTLTGLGNRRDFDRSLSWTMARAKRNQVQFALAILDIDHFKRVNDTYGHNIGDQVLVHIANEVETQIRNADRLFRWGGEEFAIIMPATSMEKAIAGAERIRLHIEKTPFMLVNEKIFLTISLGIYAGNESNDANYPLHIADQCLYRAKSSGRNKVVGGI